MKYLDENGLLYLVQKIKNWDKTKVDKVEGKGLSTNDYDAAAVAKVAASQSASEVEAIVTGKGYQTAEQVNSAINASLSNFSSVSYSIVETLPETGSTGVIYLKKTNNTSDNNIYDEYIWVNNTYELIGTTAADLTDYMKTADAVAIANTDIDTIIGSAD